MENSERPLVVAGLLIGAGIAGLMDGIILHQILQWHHLICHQGRCEPTSVADLKHKNTQDGYFHAVMWALIVAGLARLYGEMGRTQSAGAGRILTGATLLGFGLFEFIEGMIDHEILGIHHVHPGPNELAWDIGYLIFGIVIALLGWHKMQGGKRDQPVRTSTPVQSS